MMRRRSETSPKTLHTLSVLAGALALIGCAGISGADAPKPASPTVVPLLLDRDKLAGVGLAEHPPLPAEMVLEGSDKHRGEIFFSSDQIVVEVWEADEATLALREPQVYDEYVLILSGKLILTDAEGKSTEYSAGDSLVVPKGFSGSWQMLGNFRELVVIEKKAYELSEAVD